MIDIDDIIVDAAKNLRNLRRAEKSTGGRVLEKMLRRTDVPEPVSTPAPTVTFSPLCPVFRAWCSEMDDQLARDGKPPMHYQDLLREFQTLEPLWPERVMRVSPRTLPPSFAGMRLVAVDGQRVADPPKRASKKRS